MSKIAAIMLLIFSFSCVMTGCHNNDGLFGHSKSKEEAVANGSEVFEYLPSKTDFYLLSGDKIKIDTAWTEVSFTYRDGKRELDAAYGYSFSIPFTKSQAGTFDFSLSLADTLNRVFTNGMDESLTQLRPRNLYDTMKVLLEQKKPDTSIGWKRPIITDTIIFARISAIK